MKRKRKILIGTLSLFIALCIICVAYIHNKKAIVKELFAMNKTLQEEGYYMGDFEFIMLGSTYYLDKGEFSRAWKLIDNYYKKLTTRKDLIKIPEFNNNQEKINFYLNLQNPETGAFIDKSAAFCTYWAITDNIISHLEALSDSTTTPLKLKYPLRFLDEINTPEKLTAYLDDLAYVGWLASKFPQTSFVFARSLVDEAMPGSMLERTGFYNFTLEWKHALLKWMYDFQDTATGMWGPKDKKKHKLRKLDLDNTASILKVFRDNDGNDIYKEFPLKYSDELFKSSLKQLSEPFPDKDDLSKIHEWNLCQSKGFKMLLKRLWKDASDNNRKETQRLILRNIDICFENFYVEKDGAFSYYPNSEHASPDGISNEPFRDIGALSYKKQKRLWGDQLKEVKDMGTITIDNINTSDLNNVAGIPGINSIRIYRNKPDMEHLTDSVYALYYPKETKVLDVVELLPNIMQWVETSSLSMGNWKPMVEIEEEYSVINIKKPLIYKDKFPYGEVNRKYKESGGLFIVGFDKLQLPIVQVEFKYTEQ